MFVGHYAVGLAAKPIAPRVSLAILILSAVLADALWIAFFTAGLEQVVIEPGIMATNSLNLVSVPFSHGLVMDVVWAVVLAGIYFGARRDSRGAWVVFAAVLSHWVLDVVMHRPDMPLAPGIDLRFGLGLWNSRVATLLVEGVLWFAAIAVYVRATRPRGRVGVYGFWLMISILTALWLASLRGPAPPSLFFLAVFNVIFMAVVLAWSAWMDHARTLKGATP
jgi:hypothetical protein